LKAGEKPWIIGYTWHWEYWCHRLVKEEVVKEAQKHPILIPTSFYKSPSRKTRWK